MRLMRVMLGLNVMRVFDVIQSKLGSSDIVGLLTFLSKLKLLDSLRSGMKSSRLKVLLRRSGLGDESERRRFL